MSLSDVGAGFYQKRIYRRQKIKMAHFEKENFRKTFVLVKCILNAKGLQIFEKA